MTLSLAVILLGYATLFAAPSDARKIQGRNNLETLQGLESTREYQFARVVARSEITFNEFGFCTASRVGERLFLTAYHCEQPCGGTQFRLGYVRGVAEAHHAVFKCTRLVRKTLLYDYALYEAEPVDQASAKTAKDFPILALRDAPLADGQLVFAPSHPTGRPMEIDRSRDCRITDAKPFLSPTGRKTVKHLCDSEESSSGAALLDRRTGHAVALHWGGVEGEYNEAIPMDLILRDMRTHIPGTVQRLTIVAN